MGADKIQRTTVKERLAKWVKQNQPIFGFIEPDEVDGSPEAELLDKAKVKLLSKPSGKKKEKVWWLECKWKSEEDYLANTHSHWRNYYHYSDQWHKGYRFGEKFTTLSGAQNHFKTMRPTSYFNSTAGRDWRIRNIRTGEIYLLIETDA